MIAQSMSKLVHASTGSANETIDLEDHVRPAYFRLYQLDVTFHRFWHDQVTGSSPRRAMIPRLWHGIPGHDSR